MLVILWVISQFQANKSISKTERGLTSSIRIEKGVVVDKIHGFGIMQEVCLTHGCPPPACQRWQKWISQCIV